jgi:uncharacterized membrane protein
MAVFVSHLFESLLGMPRGFLESQGDWSLHFNPVWPGQGSLGPTVCNLLLALLGLFLVLFAYRDDGRSRTLRVSLGLMRSMLIALLIVLLNRPTLNVTQSRSEPSVLAILLDDSRSMCVPDVGSGADPQSRFSAAQSLFCGNNGKLLSELSKTHDLRFYRFDRDAAPVVEIQESSTPANPAKDIEPAVTALSAVKPDGDSTSVLGSILTVARDLQGQRAAGVVVLTDGRDTPARSNSSDFDQLKRYGLKVYPVAIGSDQAPKNIAVDSLSADDVAFDGDVVNAKAMVRCTGYGPNHLVHLALIDKKSQLPLLDEDGKPAETTVALQSDTPTLVELHWKTDAVGSKEIQVQATKQPGEIDDTDNAKSASVSVVDAKISVLYVDGYPRWDYRYLKTLLLRDKTISVSCLLAGADFSFLQEGNKPLPSVGGDAQGHFPTTLEQLMDYDVLVIGDTDPHYFSDTQLQLISEFVNRGGGLLMVAGQRWSPQAYRNTPIESLLPVTLSHVEPTDPSATITQGFRPVPSPAGLATGIYRFFTDAVMNDSFLKNDIPEIFWYCRGITAKPGVGEVLAEHPTDLGPDGRRAPLMVAGRSGGRTLFSAIDDSWRWRFYTDQRAFDSYWIQQLRYLARNRKINQRHLTLATDQPVYELGAQAHVTLHVIDPALNRRLPAQLRVQLNDARGQPVAEQTLLRQQTAGDEIFTSSFTADQLGSFTVQLPSMLPGVDAIEAPFSVISPRQELIDPRVDRIQLGRLAAETSGKLIDFANAAAELKAIPSAERSLPQVTGQPLWDAPLSLILFLLVISLEWIVRKLHGMA